MSRRIDQQARQLELEPDDEEEEHDAELGDAAHRLGLADERQAGRADDDAGGEVAEHGAQAEAPEQRHGDHGRGAEHQDRRQEAGVRGGARHGGGVTSGGNGKRREACQRMDAPQVSSRSAGRLCIASMGMQAASTSRGAAHAPTRTASVARPRRSAGGPNCQRRASGLRPTSRRSAGLSIVGLDSRPLLATCSP